MNYAPLPTPEALTWVYKNVLTQKERAHSTIHRNKRSVSNNPTATISTPERKLFIKQLAPYWDHSIETLITQQLTKHPNTLTYISDNKELRIIITECVPSIPHNKNTKWDTSIYRQALNTLKETQTLLTQSNFPALKTLSLPIMTAIPSNKEHTRHGLRIIEEDPHLLLITQDKKRTQQRSLIAHLTRISLQAITQPETHTQPQHTDATPENWILTQGKAILIDYGTYSYAPKHWDTNILTITSPLPSKIKVHYTFQENNEITSPETLTHTALYFLTLLLSHEKNPAHAEHNKWVNKYLQKTLDLLHELHPTIFTQNT